ncbi:Mitogen-activated protein kinase kinase kinase 3 [Bulinus truncatus]|nr:Mitogen-activated protein kinase kinase kinase 3 [Bulinus truncatus]
MNINNQAVSSETVSLAPQVPRKRKHGQKLSANVYVVEDTSYPLDKKFIVKKINTTNAKKDKQSNVSELQILKNVNHNRIVQLCGFVLKANKLSIFMDYLEQGTLAKYIQETNEHGLDIEEVRIFTRQILEGVSYLHNYQPMIIHRNIKGKLPPREGRRRYTHKRERLEAHEGDTRYNTWT